MALLRSRNTTVNGSRFAGQSLKLRMMFVLFTQCEAQSLDNSEPALPPLLCRPCHTTLPLASLFTLDEWMRDERPPQGCLANQAVTSGLLRYKQGRQSAWQAIRTRITLTLVQNLSACRGCCIKAIRLQNCLAYLSPPQQIRIITGKRPTLADAHKSSVL